MDWKPTPRVEEKYKRNLSQLMEWAWEQAALTTDPLVFLREYVASRDFVKACMHVAGSMVTAVQTDQGRTWREAAAAGSRGREMYQALRQGLTPQMRAAMERQMTENAALISRTPLDVAQYVVNDIREKAFEGLRPEAITAQLMEAFPLASANRVRLIARTETGKAYTMLTMAQAEDLGLDWYEWESSIDARVRSSHKHMQGVLVAWNDPPSPEALIGIKSVGKYHAGNIWNCRCYPSPIISWDYVKWPAKVYHSGAIRIMTKQQFLKLIGADAKVVTPVIAPNTPNTPEAKEQYGIANIPEIVQNEGAMIRIPISLGAAANRISILNPIRTMEEDIWVKEGSYISGVKTLARGNKIRDVQGLIEEHKRSDGSLSKVDDWQKMRGTGIVTDGIDDYPAELHWYEAPNVGKVKWKVKRYIEGD